MKKIHLCFLLLRGHAKSITKFANKNKTKFTLKNAGGSALHTHAVVAIALIVRIYSLWIGWIVIC